MPAREFGVLELSDSSDVDCFHVLLRASYYSLHQGVDGSIKPVFCLICQFLPDKLTFDVRSAKFCLAFKLFWLGSHVGFQILASGRSVALTKLSNSFLCDSKTCNPL